jgi:hypothetical protein
MQATRRRWLAAVCAGILLTVVGGVPEALAQQGTALKIPQSAQIQPAALNKQFQGPVQGRPLLLQVGSKVLFGQAHIPGSEYVGAGAGEDALVRRVARVPHGAAIVIYCGCCPWERCPNVCAAYEQLLHLGFTNVKVLYIAQNFGQDWVQKGYPVEQSH